LQHGKTIRQKTWAAERRMKYPNEFPRPARARVEAETLRAYAALKQDVQGKTKSERDISFIRCVMRIFLAFVREACEFGKKSGHRAWTDRELDQRCRDFLLLIVVDAWEDVAKFLGVREMFSSSGWGYSLKDDARRRIEGSDEWKQYQELLLDAFESQSHAQLSLRSSKGLPRGQAAKTAKRSKKYEAIDVALRSIAESRPTSHAEVFSALEGRAPVPNAKPFSSAGGWLSGYKRDHSAAHVWLSKAWSRLQLAAFAKGPK
jgi:hypothetical protein